MLQHALEEFDQLQEGFGSSVDIPSLDFEQLRGQFVDVVEGDGHEFDDGGSLGLIAQLLFLQESVGHVEQGIFGPGEEPVDDGRVYQGRELPGSSPEALANGGEAQGHVQFLLDLVDVPIPAVGVIPGVDFAFALDFVPDCVDDLFLLVGGVELCDLA